MPVAKPKPFPVSPLSLVRFQRYLVKNYPITSAMSYEIGLYVVRKLLTPKKIRTA